MKNSHVERIVRRRALTFLFQTTTMSLGRDCPPKRPRLYNLRSVLGEVKADGGNPSLFSPLPRLITTS
ncbi:MAG: hypothetical protein JWR69_3334 [Pedosphaera sp.]|nr:hypothetical protein [Pedosphaera sp.]